MNLTNDFEFTSFAKESAKRLGYMFYIVNPSKSSFKTVEEVPYYINQVLPCFLCFVIIEQIIHLVTNDDEGFSINDHITSISQGVFAETIKLYQKGIFLAIYIWTYENFHFFNVPWDSPWTWLLAFILTDFGYYVVHRMSHEVNFMWAAHQVHHSSEYYNYSTALRQSAIHELVSFFVYLPMAIAVPPPAYMVHQSFYLIYQFWIHTEVIKSLGPLEYILNTPSHHRVHHGRNRYCIDKNYGGTLIIWDRLFGTFEAETDEDKVVYGLVHPINTFNPLYIQLCHYEYMFKTAWNIKGWSNKVKVFIYGPGWEPGKPRGGLIEDIPDISYPCERYNPPMELWCKFYVFIHFVLFSCGYLLLSFYEMQFAGIKFHLMAVYVILSMTSVSAILDGKYYAPVFECFRCICYFLIDAYVIDYDSFGNDFVKWSIMIIRAYFLFSAVLWSIMTALSYKVQVKSMKKVN